MDYKDCVFKEKMVVQQRTTSDYIQIFLAIFLLPLPVLVLLQIQSPILWLFYPFYVIFALWAILKLIRSKNREFEYSVTNDYLDIDLITDKKTRTSIFSCQAKSIKAFGFYDDKTLENLKLKEASHFHVIDCSSRLDSNKKHYLLATNHLTSSKVSKLKHYQGLCLVILELDDDQIHTLKRYAPKIFIPFLSNIK